MTEKHKPSGEWMGRSYVWRRCKACRYQNYIYLENGVLNDFICRRCGHKNKVK
jgi:hypothetical protein